MQNPQSENKKPVSLVYLKVLVPSLYAVDLRESVLLMYKARNDVKNQ